MKAYLIPWLLLTLAACKKETELDKLPDATQKGKNTAGFLLDGNAWLPDGSNLLGTGSPAFAYWRSAAGSRMLEVTMIRDRDGTSLQFFLPNLRQTGSFQLNQPVGLPLGMRNPAYGMFIMSKSLTVPRIFLTGPTSTGSLTVTRFDNVARVVSGTFDLTVQEETSPETHQLTQGRFDLTF